VLSKAKIWIYYSSNPKPEFSKNAPEFNTWMYSCAARYFAAPVRGVARNLLRGGQIRRSGERKSPAEFRGRIWKP